MRALVALSLLLAAPAWADWSPRNAGGMTVDVYTPAGDGPRSLLIVLHGCAQGRGPIVQAGGLAVAAEDNGMVVAVPDVPGGGVLAGCWDYYGANHTRNNRHNGAVLALVDALLGDAALSIDADRVYIAGLSSGGGQAAVLGCLAPDVFAGVGVAAGPAVGTSSFEIAQANIAPATEAANCERLAGANAAALDTQLVALVNGDADFTVAPGYGDVIAAARALVFADGGPALAQSPLDVGALPGQNPRGQGTVWSDAEGPRIARFLAAGMGHAWPGGEGAGGIFVDGGNVNFGAYMAEFFAENDRRGEQGPRPVAVTAIGAVLDGDAAVVEGAAGPAARVATIEVELLGDDPRFTEAAVDAEGRFGARFEGLQAGVVYTPRATPVNVDGGRGAAVEGAAVRWVEPGENAVPVVTIDGVESTPGCLSATGTLSDDGPVEAELVVEALRTPIVAVGGAWSAEICGLAAGCYVAEAVAVDDFGAEARAVSDEVGVGEVGFDELAEGTVTDHLSRFTNHPGGWGAADATYLALFNQYGVAGRFTLYRGSDGAWYADPANLPGAPAPACGDDPEPDPDPEPEPEPEPEPDPAAAPTIDAVTVDGDCALIEGTLRVGALSAARLEVGQARREPQADADGDWAVEVCGLEPGCAAVTLRVLAADGRKWTLDGGYAAIAAPGAAESVADTVMGHIPRYANHAGGWGAVDASFVALFGRYGLGKAFTLHRGPDGWYLDPARLPPAPPPVCGLEAP